MIYTLPNVTAPTPGTPVPFTTTRTPANWVDVTALNGNVSDVYVGGVNPVNKATTLVRAATSVGNRLPKGTNILFHSISVVTYIDVSQLWLDVTTANDGISITYGIR